MLNHLLTVKTALAFKLSDDAFVRFFYMLASKVWHFVGEFSGQSHWAHQGFNTVRFQHSVIVFTKGRRLMHQARTTLCRHIVIAYHHEGAQLCLIRKVGKQWLIVSTYQLGALEILQHLSVITEVMGYPGGGHVNFLVAVLHQLIVNLRANADGQIRRQSPRRCGPNGQGSIFVFQLQQHGHRRILYILIV